MESSAAFPEQFTAVVRRRIKAGAEGRFEALMQEFIQFVLRQPGHLGITVLQPSDASLEYTVVNRFTNESTRRAFTESRQYQDWQARLREVTDGAPAIEEMGGLAAWFTIPNRPGRRPPPKYKMALVTLLGVYPLSMLFPQVVRPIVPGWPPWLIGLVVASLIVVSLTWLVMPNLTRIFEAWLFNKEKQEPQ